MALSRCWGIADFDTAFLESFGIDAGVVLENFLVGALDGSGAGGPIGNSLFEIAELTTEHSTLVAECNALIAAPGSGIPKRAEWQCLSERYVGLSQRMATLEVKAQVLTARTSYAVAFIWFSEAAEFYSSTSANAVALGNAALAGGNTVMGEGNDLLNGLAGLYLWTTS